MTRSTGRRAHTPRFLLGRLTETPGALNAFATTGENPINYVARHMNLDPGALGLGEPERGEPRRGPGAHVSLVVSAASLMMFLLHFCRERTIFEGQPIGLAAASNGVAGLHIIGQGDDLIAGGTAHSVSERRGPSARAFTNPERVPGAVRALQQVARPGTLRHLYERATVRAGYRRHQRIPKSRCNRPRS